MEVSPQGQKEQCRVGIAHQTGKDQCKLKNSRSKSAVEKKTQQIGKNPTKNI
jgi:hypothetical protein